MKIIIQFYKKKKNEIYKLKRCENEGDIFYLKIQYCRRYKCKLQKYVKINKCLKF